MSPEIQRIPPYQQIADHYRDKILKGEVADGARLPSGRELSETWNCTPNTATRALTRLQAEGLIRILPTGAIVTAHETNTYSPRDRAMAALNQGAIYPPSERSSILAAEYAPAPPAVADALGVEAGTPVVRRRRVIFHNNLAVSLATSWLPAEFGSLAPALLERVGIPGGTIGVIREVTGRVVEKGHDVLCARIATADVAQDLGVGEGAPVLYGRNLWTDEAGDVIEVGEFVIPADRSIAYNYTVDVG